MSQAKAQENSRNAQVNTGDVAEMPKQTTVSLNQQTSQNADKIAQTWNGLTASQQLAALTGNKDLASYLKSK